MRHKGSCILRSFTMNLEILFFESIFLIQNNISSISTILMGCMANVVDFVIQKDNNITSHGNGFTLVVSCSKKWFL